MRFLKQTVFTLSLLILTLSSGASAKNINVTYDGKYSSYLEFLKLDVKNSKSALNKYFSRTLRCTKVTVCLTKIQERIIRESDFTITIDATCKLEVKDLNIALYPAEDDSVIQLKYRTPSGTKVEKTLQLPLPDDESLDEINSKIPECF